MERFSEPILIGDIIDGAMQSFWKPNTKAEEAAKFSGGDVYTDGDGVVRCKRCRAPRMFYLDEARRWLPCACKCAGQESEEDFASRVAALRANSGIIGRYAGASFEKAERTQTDSAVFDSCMRCIGIKSAAKGTAFICTGRAEREKHIWRLASGIFCSMRGFRCCS